MSKYKKIFEELKKSSPVPVYMRKMRDGQGGRYHFNYSAEIEKLEESRVLTKTRGIGRNFITINSNVSISSKVYFLVHELQHEKCDKNNCFCQQLKLRYIDRYYSELHAQRAAIKFCKKRKLKKSLKKIYSNLKWFQLKEFKNNKDYPFFRIDYTPMANYLLDYPIWKKCWNYLTDELIRYVVYELRKCGKPLEKTCEIMDSEIEWI